MADDGATSPFDLAKLVRNVSKIVREKTEDLFGEVSPLDRTLREITDEDSCTVANSLLRSVALATKDPSAYHPVAQTVWRGIASDPAYWRRIYKCLSLLEFMILLGPDRCRTDCMLANMTLRNLMQFRFHDGRRDQGGGVRQRAESIVKILEDDDAFKEAQARAVRDNEFYHSAGENLPYFSVVNNPVLTANRNSAFFTGPGSFPNPFQLRQDIPAPRFERAYDPGDDDFSTTNPFTTVNKLQSTDEAGKPWGISPQKAEPAPPPSSLLDEDFTTDPFAAPAAAVAPKPTVAASPLSDLFQDAPAAPAVPVQVANPADTVPYPSLLD